MATTSDTNSRYIQYIGDIMDSMKLREEVEAVIKGNYFTMQVGSESPVITHPTPEAVELVLARAEVCETVKKDVLGAFNRYGNNFTGTVRHVRVSWRIR